MVTGICNYYDVKPEIPKCTCHHEEMYEGASSSGRVYYCSRTQTQGTYDAQYAKHMEESGKISKELLFLIEKRNEEIKRAWKKDQYWVSRNRV